MFLNVQEVLLSQVIRSFVETFAGKFVSLSVILRSPPKQTYVLLVKVMHPYPVHSNFINPGVRLSGVLRSRHCLQSGDHTSPSYSALKVPGVLLSVKSLWFFQKWKG